MKRITVLTAVVLIVHSTFAGHILGGNISYQCLGSNNYEVTLSLFRDCSGAQLLPQNLQFYSSCGQSFLVSQVPPDAGIEVSQVCNAQLNQSTCAGGTLPGTVLHKYTSVLNLPDCENWTISWSDCCRITSVNAVGTFGTYLETTFDNSDGACYDSPEFNHDVAPYLCSGQNTAIDMSVSNDNGELMRYSFIDARFAAPNPGPIFYQSGYSGAQPDLSMTIDSLSGIVNYTPSMVGDYVVVVEAKQFDSNGELMTTVMRDIFFRVVSCSNSIPEMSNDPLNTIQGDVLQTDSNLIVLCPGGDFCFDALISDPDAQQSVSLSSNVEQLLPGSTVQLNSGNPATATICWTPAAGIQGDYPFSITAEDDNCPVTVLQGFSFNVRVLAAADSLCVLNSINESAAEERFSIYPNPATESILIAGLKPHHRVSMVDVAGKSVQVKQLSNGFFDIDHYPTGLYTVIIENEGERSVKRFVKE